MQARYPWLWDTNLDRDGFDAALQGKGREPSRDERWALTRLIEYAPFNELKRLLPHEKFLQHWPEITPGVRSKTRRKGMDFFYQWLRQERAAHE